MSRPIEDTPTSPYAVLGVSRHATAEQIKHAYRSKAKAAHPDAGGSVAAMARVNDAYRVLSDPGRRRSYDYDHPAGQAAHTTATAHHASSATHPHHEARHHAHYSSTATAHGHAGAEARPKPEPEHRPHTNFSAETAAYEARERRRAETTTIDRERAAWARDSAFELLRVSGPLALIMVVAHHLVRDQITGLSANLFFDFLTFIPVYGVVLGVMFMLDPPLRLVFADLVRSHPTSREERISGLGLILGTIPALLMWEAVSAVLR